jgi:hypothetical protein
MGKLRCLRLPASFALNTCLPPQMLLASLLPATHLAVDLQSKLKLLVNKARRPAGLMPPPAASGAAAAAAGPGGLLGPLCMPATAGVPVCLQGVSLQELVQQLLPMLPALQTHLATALSVIRQPPEPGREVLLEGGIGFGLQVLGFPLPAVVHTCARLGRSSNEHDLTLLQCPVLAGLPTVHSMLCILASPVMWCFQVLHVCTGQEFAAV